MKIFSTTLALLLFSGHISQAKPSASQIRAQNSQLIADLTTGLPSTHIQWKHIVIHHTASEWSSKASIHRYHKKKFNDPDGIEYHFLIGNGKKAGDGVIERARWSLQKRAIHLFKPAGAPDAIAISLVGNFHERSLGKAQYTALLDLVAALAWQYKIPVARITTHTRVDGNLTVCPGRYFPFKRLSKDLRQNLADRAESAHRAESAYPR